MSSNRRLTTARSITAGCVGLLLATFSAGATDKIEVYRVPKEKTPQMAQANPHGGGHAMDDGHGHGAARVMPKVTYTTPEGWTEAGAGEMRVAGFNIAGTNGQTAQVAITPLPGMVGKESIIVNMWRQQVGLGELSDDEAGKELAVVDIGGESGKMFDMAGKSAAGVTIRIVTAMAHRGDMSWFYKLQGDDELVTAQKANFVAFLKSVKIEEAAAPAALPDGHPPISGGAMPGAVTTAEPPAPREGGPTWPKPSDWKEVSPGQMQVAKFSVPEVGGAKADVMISVFPSSTGGTLANVNRWRKQIGLAPVEESSLTQLVKPLDEKIPDALLTDMNNGGRRLVGAIVPGGGQWYFFKLLGDDAAVAPQKNAFIKFVKEVKY